MGKCKVEWDKGGEYVYDVAKPNQDICIEAFAMRKLETCTPYTDQSCQKGARVRRGPDWMSGDEDGGAVFDSAGTVVGPSPLLPRSCEVQWDKGGKGYYRVGIKASYDLCDFPYVSKMPPPGAFDICIAVFCILTDLIGTAHTVHLFTKWTGKHLCMCHGDVVMAQIGVFSFLVNSAAALGKLFPPNPPAYSLLCSTVECYKISHVGIITICLFTFELLPIFIEARVLKNSPKDRPNKLGVCMKSLQICGSIVWVIYEAVNTPAPGIGTLALVVFCCLKDIFLLYLEMKVLWNPASLVDRPNNRHPRAAAELVSVRHV